MRLVGTDTNGDTVLAAEHSGTDLSWALLFPGGCTLAFGSGLDQNLLVEFLLAALAL